MTFLEKLTLVIVASLLSVLTTLVTNWVISYSGRKKVVRNVKKDMQFLAENLEVAILNLSAESVSTEMQRALASYSAIESDKRLSSAFLKLHSIFSFLQAGGYIQNPERATQDIQRLTGLREELR